MARTRTVIGRMIAVLATGALVGLALPTSAQATSYEAGTFVMGVGSTPHIHVYGQNVAASGVAVKGTLKGWRLELVAYESSECFTSCEWFDMRFYLSNGTDAVWGGCYRFSDGYCSQAGRTLLTGDVDMPVSISGGTNQFASISGSGRLSGSLSPPPWSLVQTGGLGELRLSLSLG